MKMSIRAINDIDIPKIFIIYCLYDFNIKKVVIACTLAIRIRAVDTLWISLKLVYSRIWPINKMKPLTITFTLCYSSRSSRYTP